MIRSVECARVAAVGTVFVHILGIHVTLVMVLIQVNFAPIIFVDAYYWFKGKFLPRRGSPEAFFGRTAPLFGILRSTPTMRTFRLFQRRSMHLEWDFEM